MKRSGHKLATIPILAAALLASVAIPAHADTVIKRDGAKIEGSVILLSPRAVRIVANGIVLDLPRDLVAQVEIQGAAGCEEPVVEARAYLREKRYREAADAVSFGLQSSGACQALGELAQELMRLPVESLAPELKAQLAANCAEFPAINALLVKPESGLDVASRLSAGRNGLQYGTGEAFLACRDGMLQLLQEQLTEATAAKRLAQINECLVGIAELFTLEGQPIGTREQYQANRSRSDVERLRHAVALIPLPPDFRNAGTSITQLAALAQSGMQSAADAVSGKLERYFFDQAGLLAQRLQQDGDYPRFTADVESWMEHLSPEIAVQPRILEAQKHLQGIATREAEPYRERLRLQALAEANSMQFLNEIDSQLIRFQNNATWTKDVVVMMQAHRQRLAALRDAALAAITPTPAPTPEPTPENPFEANYDQPAPAEPPAAEVPPTEGS